VTHGPRTAGIESVANLNDIWLMMEATSLPRSAGLPPYTKPLNVPEHFNSFSPLRLVFEKGCVPLQICQHQKREQALSRLPQVVTLGWLIQSLGQGAIWSGLWTNALSLTCTECGKTKDRISILCLKLHQVFKLKSVS
jgi:hypothetical protein